LLAYGGVLFADDRDGLGIEDRVQGTSVSERRFGRTAPKFCEAACFSRHAAHRFLGEVASVGRVALKM